MIHRLRQLQQLTPGRLKPKGTFINQFVNERSFELPRVNTPTIAPAGVTFDQIPSERAKWDNRSPGGSAQQPVQNGDMLDAAQSRQVLQSWWELLFECIPEDRVVEHCKLL